MLSIETIKNLSVKFQTRESNVVQEYLQHLFLSALYMVKESENLLFKGGTALRIIYQSPRFSEDLDFSLIHFAGYQQIEDVFLTALEEMEKEGVFVELKEAKSTTGGYLGIINYNLYHFKGEIFFEVSLRKQNKLKGAVEIIISEYIPSYTMIHLPASEIVQETISAALDRGKPRDYYDLYFMLRHPELNKLVDKEKILDVKQKIIEEKINFKKELKNLLPISHQLILRNFKETLIREIERYE